MHDLTTAAVPDLPSAVSGGLGVAVVVGIIIILPSAGGVLG